MPDPLRFSAVTIARLHDEATALWHQNPDAHPASENVRPGSHPFYATVLAQHRANFDLWHVEDRARDPRATDAGLAQIKRSIDGINQTRNDLAEQCDILLLESVAEALRLPERSAPTPHPEAPASPSLPAAVPLHSESPGLIIDRLSILALKLFHTHEEIARPAAPPGHAERNHDRFILLTEQRDDLVACLDQLWTDVLAGRRRFKLYRQLKMYNDPALNPAIYGADL